MRTTPLSAWLGLVLASAPAFGQTSASERPPGLSEAEEVALALSAAPAHVTEGATILVLRGDRYVVARAGDNGNTCYVGRSQRLSLEPICFDPEAAATILPIELRRFELRSAGADPDQIEREIGAAIAAGELRLPTRPALAYMMSSGQILYNDEGRRVGNWMPHLHVYYPYLHAADLGLHEPNIEAAVLADEGKATSSIIVAVRGFVDPESVER